MEQWYVYCKKADFLSISNKFNISPMLARILRNREINSDEEIDLFLNASVERMYDPFLLKGMDKAVKMTADAIEGRKKIRIIGDYDADGVCSSYILSSYITFAGGIVDVRLPDRENDGYGMSPEMAVEAGNANVELIITCDNGISAVNAVAKAKELGIDVIVTDHHEAPEKLPEADVIIDPKQKDCTYPYSEICGASVAYKLVSALAAELKERKGLDSEEILDELLQFAGIATITDIVPLKDENRIFAKEGIKRLKATKNPGLKALMEIKHIKKDDLSAMNVGFIIGPAINSAGRLKNAMIAFDLLAQKDETRAKETAAYLAELNEKRKKLTEEQAQEAMAVAEEKVKTDKVLVIYLPSAHESIAGIVAGKIKETFNRPALVLTNSNEGIKGSGRSIDSYNIIEEISAYPELFSKFGGHAKACGFTLKCSAEELSEILNESCSLSDDDLIKKIWIDMQLPFEFITEEFVNELDSLEPFGVGNEKPVFAEKDVKAVSASIVGKNNNCLRMRLKNASGKEINAVMFGNDTEILNSYESVNSSETISLLFYPEVNEFRGVKSLQLRIISMKFHEKEVKS